MGSTPYETEEAPRRRRRGLLVLLLTGSIVTMIGAGTMSMALFTDTSSASGGFTAGTINIATSPSVLFAVDPMMPGDDVSAALKVDNDGTGEFRYAMTTSAAGTLASQLTLTVETGDCSAAGTELYSGALGSGGFGSTAPGPQAGDRTLAGGTGTEDLCFTVSLPAATGNGYQGTSATATFTFHAEQTANNNTP
jgi:hypothetical protein